MNTIPTERILGGMAGQLVNSALESTRIFWRTKLGLPEELIHDPIHVQIIIKE